MNSAVVFHADRPKKKAANHRQVNRELSRLIGAALINKTFCRLLLVDPVKAIKSGFNGEYFDLTPQDYTRVRQIRASSLEDFARQVVLGKDHDSAAQNQSRRLIPKSRSFRSEIAAVPSAELLSA